MLFLYVYVICIVIVAISAVHTTSNKLFSHLGAVEKFSFSKLSYFVHFINEV
jgi:hypothetical protein